MALGAVLISLSLAVMGAVLIGVSHGAFEAMLIYAALGTGTLFGIAVITAALRRDDTR